MSADINNPHKVFKSYLDASPAPAWISDDSGRMLFINRVACYLWRIADDYEGKTISELFPKPASEQFIDTDQMVLDSGKPIEFVVPSIRLNGSKGYYMLHKFLIPADLPNRLIAGQAIDITEEKKLEEELRNQKVQEQKNISRIIIDTQEQERNELAWQLQNNVNQVLATATVLLGYSKKAQPDDKDKCIEKSQGYIFKAIEDLRNISCHLNTSIITDFGLLDTLSDLIENLKLTITTDVEYEITPGIENSLTKSKKQLIYRIVQQQVNNIIAHSGATKVTIKIIEIENLLFLSIGDDGKGADFSNSKYGNGLTTILHTVNAFNGDLEIITSPGRGFNIKICLPLETSNIYENYAYPYQTPY